MSSTTPLNSKVNLKKMPGWALPAALITAVVIVSLIAFRALSGGSETAAGPDKVVRPGMYDFRQEAQKGNLGRRTSGEGGIAP